MTPNVKDLRRKPKLLHMEVFYNMAKVQILYKKRSLNQKLGKIILFNYSLEQKEYKFFNPTTWK